MEDSVLLASLLIAHVLADFFIQPSSWIRSREARHFASPTLYLHGLIHGAFSLVILALWESLNYAYTDWTSVVGAALIVTTSHILIDGLKSSLPGKPALLFAIDQALHLLIIVLVWQHFSGDASLLVHSVSAMLNGNTLLIILGYLVLLKPTSVITAMVMKSRLPTIEGEHPERVNNGELIGYLERLLGLTFVLLGEFTGIGFMLAAKSVFRFGDLTNPQQKHMTEYVMLGTLLSITITVLVGVGLNLAIA